ncbi:MAG: N-acetylneuraminate synthase family protein [Candidatus Nanoarchaeia archaeon]|nr:N-acetylneuraminate synthase family protein [Candidatus Nanoarchaeia archaeon]MDD5358113.1 N-acetylneuraminate synthase family protein [Candidatus Nanoarchaeia archaeon]MDD5589300.1 N-acetylneuraminate synthase family protein [Candidatus Nanoarchaeia archaeon]
MKKKLSYLFDKEKSSEIKKPLFIFDIANNHNGDVEHGLKIIRETSKVCNGLEDKFLFGFKFQYRDLDSFIHPDYKDRKDISYVKRFSDTKLTRKEFELMKNEIENGGFISVCTPFDENSVDLIEEQNFDIIKIASCSFTDWPLLERIVKTDKPIIASTAGATLEELDRVVSFLEHRDKKSVLMHCVGEYPTKKESLQLNQIDLLKKRYPEITIGFSTHEEPNNLDAVKIAVGKGAQVFERHVNVESEKYSINAYSSTPGEIKKWLQSAEEAYEMCGVENNRHISTEKEKNDLRRFRRGVFVKRNLKEGELLTKENIFYAFPCGERQILANDMSKYIEYIPTKDINTNEAINLENLTIKNSREDVLRIVKKLKDIVLESHIILPNRIELELSHHYGIENYEKFGAAILNCINREYCKKLIILLPGQNHPLHYHEKKEETFQVLYGDMNLKLGNEKISLKPGDIQTVERKVNHSFSSEKGCIFEEVSTTHYNNDSFYENEEVRNNKNRKTHMTFWADWLSGKTIE